MLTSLSASPCSIASRQGSTKYFRFLYQSNIKISLARNSTAPDGNYMVINSAELAAIYSSWNKAIRVFISNCLAAGRQRRRRSCVNNRLHCIGIGYNNRGSCGVDIT